MDPDLKQLLRDLRNHGLKAEFFAEPDACSACRALAGKVFDPRQAPVIPVPRCENETCRCDYLPALGGAQGDFLPFDRCRRATGADAVDLPDESPRRRSTAGSVPVI